jgi:CHASE2 domain-containing sensor protein
MKTAFKHTIFTYLTLGLLSLIFFNISIFNFIEDAFDDFSYLDLIQSKNIFKYDKVNSDIILVNIENRDREELAFLIEHLANQSPKVIGIDAVFREKRDAYKDSVLASTIKYYQDILVGSYIYPNIQNHKMFAFSKQGFVNFNPEADNNNVIRDFVTNKDSLSSFSYIITSKVNEKKIKAFEGIRSIKYYGNYQQFLHMSFNDVMQQETIPHLKNKIVILGYLGMPLGNVNDILDKKFTPLNTNFTGKTIPDMYGVTIHANIINSLIKEDFIKETPNLIIILINFLVTFLTSLLFIKIHKKGYTNETLIEKSFQLIYSFLMIWVSLLLFSKGIKFPVVFIILCPILAIEMISYSEFFNNLSIKKWLTSKKK